MKVRLPRHPAAYVNALPEPVKLEIYDKTLLINGLDIADLVFVLELNITGVNATATFTVQETLDLDGRLVKIKKRVTLPARPFQIT